MNAGPSPVAVIGAGIAGAACARLLADAGVEVQLFEKSRGVGGRLATRRAEWTADRSSAQQSSFDHGAPGFTAHAPDFARVVEQAARDGLLSRWHPRNAPGSYAPLDEPVLWIPTPDMPAWCRALVSGLTVHTGCMVDALQRSTSGWSVHSAQSMVADGFDAVLVAIPAKQAAALVRPHRAEWAHRAEAMSMLPGWVLMGVTDDQDPKPLWDLAWPISGDLAWVIRNDAKPGRARVPGLAHWVVHATARWSQMHLERPAEDVQAALQAALARWLGRSLEWKHAAVHRWRYASAPRATHPASGTASRCWWDASLGLGVCGDALGGAGVEGAWCSARALASRVIDHTPGSQAQGRVAPFPLAHS